MKIQPKVRVAVVGLRFGGEFPPIHRLHPDVEHVGICDCDETLLHRYGDRFGFDRRHTDFEELLEGDEYNAIHILTPLALHAKMSIAALEAGKHCACTVPMGLSIDELRAIVAAQRKSGANYMMMETAVYTYQCLYTKDLIEKGEIGRIQYLRGAHYQDLEGWPDYWKGLPPLHYATHAVAPLLALSNTRAAKVHCFGSGVMRDELVEQYGNPYPIETAIFQLEPGPLAAEVSRSLFHTARDYIECFSVYGDKASIEWHMEREPPVLFKIQPLEEGTRGRDVTYTRVVPPDRRDLLPEPIRKFTEHNTVLDEKNPHLSIIQGGGHHGSHPHMVHEFVRSIVEERAPWIDAVTSANWTAAGICAHESATKDGAEVAIPSFT
jgi:predicted dehydrogenase